MRLRSGARGCSRGVAFDDGLLERLHEVEVCGLVWCYRLRFCNRLFGRVGVSRWLIGQMGVKCECRSYQMQSLSIGRRNFVGWSGFDLEAI